MGTTAEPKPGDKGSDSAHPLAVTKQDTAALSEVQRQEIALRKNANIVTAQLAGTNWGKGLDEPTRRAVADWGGRNGIDVTTEIFVLGGNIYLNAQFYQNRLVGLLHRGLILDYRQEFIQADPRLQVIVDEPIDTKLPPELVKIAEADRAEAFAEIRRRRRLRIEHGAPDKAPSGVENFAIGLTTIVLAAMPHTPIRGVKWAPHDKSDPVGTNYPQETALTRSSRRALKQCVTHIPELARWVDGSAEDAIANVAEQLRANEQRLETEKRAQLTAGAGEPGQRSVAQADYLNTRKDDITEIRGPVSVVEPPRHPSDPAWVAGESVTDRASHEVAGDVDDVRGTRSLDDEIPETRGAGGDPGDEPEQTEIDDVALMDDDERREWEERKRREAAGRK